jgi:anti-sigma factor RsiW
MAREGRNPAERRGEEGISPELAAKIAAFVDRASGQERPLSPSDEGEIRRLLETDGAVRDLVKRLCVAKAGLETLADDEPGPARRPRRPGHRAGAGQEHHRDGPTGRGALSPSVLAAAAVIAILIGGGFLYLDRQIAAERTGLEGEIAALRQENERLASTLRAASEATAALQADRDRASEALAAAEASLAPEREELLAERSALSLERDRLIAALADKDGQVTRLSSALDKAVERSDAADAALVELRAERPILQTKLAALEAELQGVDAAKKTADAARVAAEQQVAALKDGGGPDQDWLAGLAGQHRIFAAAERRHQVARPAVERPAIEAWLADLVGRPLTVPDLEAKGVVFEGARLMALDGRPAAALIYRDDTGQPLTLGLTAGPAAIRGLAESKDSELNLVAWQDGALAFALVGAAEPARLADLAGAIKPANDS